MKKKISSRLVFFFLFLFQNRFQTVKPARKNRQTLKNNNAYYVCGRRCQTLITGQTLTPLMSHGRDAKSESRYFQNSVDTCDL